MVTDNQVRRLWYKIQPYDLPLCVDLFESLFTRLNSGRKGRFQEELSVLRRLPERRLNDFKRQRVKVGPGSAIRLQHNVYSVPSRLKGEWVETRLYEGGGMMVNNQLLIGYLKELHVPTIRECFEDIAQTAEQESLSYECYLTDHVRPQSLFYPMQFFGTKSVTCKTKLKT